MNRSSSSTTRPIPLHHQPGRARVALRCLAHAFEAGGLRSVGHALAQLRIARRIERLQAAIEREREVHGAQLARLGARLNDLLGQQQQARIVGLAWLLNRYLTEQPGERLDAAHGAGEVRS